MIFMIFYIILCCLWCFFCNSVEKCISGRKYSYVMILNFLFAPISMLMAIRRVKKDFNKSIPEDATVFAVKESIDSSTGLEAFIGYKQNNGNFCFEQRPFEDHSKNSVRRIKDVKLGDSGGLFEIRKVDSIKFCNYCGKHAAHQIWICSSRIIQKQASLTLCDTCIQYLKMLIVNIS